MKTVKANEQEIAEVLAALKENPLRIRKVTSKVKNADLQVRASKTSWSVNDILAHLRACADVWGGTIERMLAEEMPRLPDIHPRKWITQTDYLKLDFHTSFSAYVDQREKLLKILMKLPFEDWSRGAIIGGRIHTVFTQARRIAKHETQHCEQIEELLKK